MSTPSVLTGHLNPPPFDVREALRYAGVRGEDGGEIPAMLEDCWQNVRDRLLYRVCHLTLPLKITGNRCDFGLTVLTSGSLARHLLGCDRALIFAATAGPAIDRQIAASRLSPVRALLYQAIGTERIEALCDAFCDSLGEGAKSRFSPGYGDLPLSAQREIFRLLDPSRRIGLSLSDSLLMSPTKSVTAIVGLCKNEKEVL